ncbi:MAG: YceH family protein [Pseudomonadota bacterium]|nr:YceH family protein [Pseudomonadota bacterium]
MPEEIDPDQSSGPQPPALTPVEARVLGCLMEKQRTTPDVYPLTLNALTQACNQKTSRNPVMSLSVGEVGHTVNQLRDRGLVHASFAGRAERYEHKMASNYHLNRPEQALICALMLRGPQTVGEVRTNAGRMAEFADLDAVEETLLGLEEREQPLVTLLPRLPGKREERFGHLLCGDIEQELPAAQPVSSHADPRDDRIAALEDKVAKMRKELDVLWELNGLSERKPVP